jgi:uncharacterized protein with NAD-binding domain and iron-sulfur cluster
VKRVLLESGESVEADAVVCATPLSSFLTIIPEEIRSQYRELEQAAFSAIASVNLWFSQPLFDDLFVGFLDTDIQWAFHRRRLWEGRGASPGYVSLVLSGAAAYSRLSSQELIRLALRDLRRCFPALKEDPAHATVVWEKQATPSPTPSFWRNRPSVATDLENLFLAGDWVDSGLPPTIEAACRSGHRAAAAAKALLEKEIPVIHDQRNVA